MVSSPIPCVSQHGCPFSTSDEHSWCQCWPNQSNSISNTLLHTTWCRNGFLQLQLISSLLITYCLGPLFVQVPSSKPALHCLYGIIAPFFYEPKSGLKYHSLSGLGQMATRQKDHKMKPVQCRGLLSPDSILLRGLYQDRCIDSSNINLMCPSWLHHNHNPLVAARSLSIPWPTTHLIAARDTEITHHHHMWVLIDNM